MKVVALDHIALHSPDVERALAFYTGLLGLEPVDLDAWRAGVRPFPSARVNESTIIDFFAADQTPDAGRLAHVCLVVEPLDWDAEIAAGLPVESGPVRRSGARGDGTSVYLTDPDGNTVELRHYGPA